MALPIQASASQTQADRLALSTGAITVSPQGINFGEIMQNYQQPPQNGGAGIYPESRLFSGFFDLPEASIYPSFVAEQKNKSVSIAAYAVPLFAVAALIYVLAR